MAYLQCTTYNDCPKWNVHNISKIEADFELSLAIKYCFKNGSNLIAFKSVIRKIGHLTEICIRIVYNFIAITFSPSCHSGIFIKYLWLKFSGFVRIFNYYFYFSNPPYIQLNLHPISKKYASQLVSKISLSDKKNDIS